ncbi:hypothetical protein IEQ34_017225 [Dendrobium chrysotoxum]|uniref:Uncharacterized protein n=1 Tax=Dendrobium chrysotoxum TaxID=161865 RepID=A0AAV7G9J8_DENCH|nr:hypothetical protein IEQ34_017225 [Dendrobium chrysotoxum]
MHDMDIILHDSVTVGEIKPNGPRQGIAPREAEEPAAADDGHLPHWVERRVATQYGEDAAVIHGHEEAQLLLGRPGVHALGPAHWLRLRVGAFGQKIVHYGYNSEERKGLAAGGRFGDWHCGGVAASDDIVEVEVEVAELFFELLFVGRGGGGNGGEEEEEEEGEEKEAWSHRDTGEGGKPREKKEESFNRLAPLRPPSGFCRTTVGPPEACTPAGPPPEARTPAGPPAEARTPAGPPSEARTPAGPPSEAQTFVRPPPYIYGPPDICRMLTTGLLTSNTGQLLFF